MKNSKVSRDELPLSATPCSSFSFVLFLFVKKCLKPENDATMAFIMCHLSPSTHPDVHDTELRMELIYVRVYTKYIYIFICI